MKPGKSNRIVIGVVVLVAFAVGFWIALLSPKREEASKLSEQVSGLKSSLAQHQAEVAEAEAAKSSFPADYQRFVVVGKAVPGDDEIASLLVQMNRIADTAGGKFSDIQLTAAGGEAEAASTGSESASGEGTPASPTEVAASLLPLGATVGPAGLAVMPYSVTLEGNFFQIADFIKGLDSLVDTKRGQVVVDGRLVTINGFSLEAAPNKGFPALQASFALTTYLTPPNAGPSAGAAPEGIPVGEATPAAATIGGTP